MKLITQLYKASAYSRRKLLVEIRKLEAVVKADHWDRLAAELQDVLLHGWNKVTKEAIDTAIRRLFSGDNAQLELFSEYSLEAMIRELRPLLGDKFAGDVAAAIKEIELSAYGAGLTGSVKLQPTFNIVDRKAIDFLGRHNIYWVKHFFDDHLREKVQEFGTKIISEGLSREAAGNLFAKEFAGKYEAYSWRYWQGFSNHVVTRSREFGNVERYVRAGIEYLQVKAVVDHRTTEICRHMHNRIISVKKAVELRDELIAAEDPEQVKQIAPWMKPEAVITKPSTALPTGLSLPPYHFNCRSRTVKYSEDKVSVIESRVEGERMEDGKRLNAYSNEEYGEWVKNIKSRKRISYGDEAERHLKKHAGKFGLAEDDRNGYLDAGMKILKDSDRVYARIFEDSNKDKKLQFSFYSDNGFVVIGDDMQFHGIFPHRGKEASQKAFQNQRKKGLWLVLTNKK